MHDFSILDTIFEVRMRVNEGKSPLRERNPYMYIYQNNWSHLSRPNRRHNNKV